MELSGHIVDVVKRRIFKGRVVVQGQVIHKIIADDSVREKHYILPGLIDSHIHIESSMLIPSEFARLACVHGTVASVSDPHEIANVLGMQGVEFMIGNGSKVPFKFYFGAPSCVPATPFETSGATLDSAAVEQLLARSDIYYLAEMMNFPGVINGDAEVLAKLAAAAKHGKPVDGHAPGLRGTDAATYIRAGISSDHECYSLQEALEKIELGMMVQIREGSAARNYAALAPLLASHPDKVMLCSDDRHPHDLRRSHMDALVRKGLADGYDVMDILQAALLNPIRHYGLDVGRLQEGDAADLIVVDSLESFQVLQTWINGTLVATGGQCLFDRVEEAAPNHFHVNHLDLADLRLPAHGGEIRLIEALDGELLTRETMVRPRVRDGFLVSDVDADILKIMVLNRYAPARPAVAFVRGFGFKNGAIALSVAHDSHNIVAVGASDEELLRAVQLVNAAGGGLSWVNHEDDASLPLPVAGIMSNQDADFVAREYERLHTLARSLGTGLQAPYMTLSFMSLLVIPELKLSDKGLFDGKTFRFVDLEV